MKETFLQLGISIFIIVFIVILSKYLSFESTITGVISILGGKIVAAEILNYKTKDK